MFNQKALLIKASSGTSFAHKILPMKVQIGLILFFFTLVIGLSAHASFYAPGTLVVCNGVKEDTAHQLLLIQKGVLGQAIGGYLVGNEEKSPLDCHNYSEKLDGIKGSL